MEKEEGKGIIVLKMKFSAMFSTSLMGECVGETDKEIVLSRPIRIFEAMGQGGAVSTHYVADDMWSAAPEVTISKEAVEYYRELDETLAADLKMIKSRESAQTELRARNAGIHMASKGPAIPQPLRST